MLGKLVTWTASQVEPRAPEKLRPLVTKVFDLADALVSGKGERARSARMALLTFSIRVLSAFLTYGSQVVFARYMGAFDYGVFVVVWTWVLMLSVLTALGLPLAVLRLIPQYTETNEMARLRGALFSTRWIAFGSASLVAGAGVLATVLAPGLFNDAFILPIVLAAVLLPMMALIEVQDGIGRAYEWPDIAFIPPFIARPVLVLVTFFAALALGFPATAPTAVGAAVVATWIVTFVQFVMLEKRLKKTVPAGPREHRPVEWTLLALPMLAIEGFLFLILNTDVVIAGWFVSPDEVAVYYAAAKTLALVHFVYFAIRATTAHKIAAHAASGDRVKLESTVHDAVQWTFWPSLVLGLTLLAFSGFILSIFGEGFESGSGFLAVLMVGVLIRASIGPAEAFLTMNGAQNQAALVYAVVFATNFGLNLALLPFLGLMGAAIATAVAMLVETVLLATVVYRRTGIICFVVHPRHRAPLAASPEPAE
ncbi:MAG: lipopolysaccharide biosynthesis protein [Hyphomicrobiaceae bacterium]|nr:lipopolysaccharide biosynthesis protein [Hyphomicrobiaceae bacterium]